MMMCLKESSRMRHLATKHHALLRSNYDAVDAVLQSYWPTPASMVAEILGETRGYAHRLFD